MPILGVNQPQIIVISSELRLRKFDNNFEFALHWYQDLPTLKLLDNRDKEPYDLTKVTKMYNYLNNIGELYFIEVKENNRFKPIGDVTFWQNDMPIVIGEKSYRGKGIGFKVVKSLIERAKTLGYQQISIREIYKFNVGSQKTFEKAGFTKNKATKNGYSYILNLA
ncbi:GNAT family N-acetyltransferase [Clostridium sp. 'deep sea']|uniref:GNAT family N-acetyltransferase n=1 Tax=Clostridium sp. 'deep sea' TaxID=2779445 RepID=UPI0018967550|nr:GNAT family protein [Clostridium sp. 'deep sea']QOR35132.1 GNAT family N-acetyltransferase [Clostridium sp. 'deep sea']